MDYSCGKFGDFGLRCFGYVMWRDTYTQTESQNDADDRYTDATTVGVSNK